MCNDKTIRGASEFLESGKLDSANIVYQIGSNDVDESDPEEVADSMVKLILDTQRLLPESRIITSVTICTASFWHVSSLRFATLSNI